jgi:hypothetical protein
MTSARLRFWLVTTSVGYLTLLALIAIAALAMVLETAWLLVCAVAGVVG